MTERRWGRPLGLAVIAAVAAAPTPIRAPGTVDPLDPRRDPPVFGDPEVCTPTWQIDGGISWLKLTWRWSADKAVDPVDDCSGVGLLQIVDGAGVRVGFVRVESPLADTRVEHWRWLPGKSWPASFKVKPMSYTSGGTDDSAGYEAVIDQLSASVGSAADVRAADWDAVFSEHQDYTWSGFAESATEVSAGMRGGTSAWWRGSPTPASDGPTVWAVAGRGSTPTVWYGSDDEEITFSGSGSYVSFTKIRPDAAPTMAYKQE